MAQAYTSVLKFTVDGRPYIKEIHDLFSALITQIKFDTHRYLFRNYDKTFSSEDAIKVLGSLRFSQSICVPDSKDPSRLVTTITTTTFKMERGVAKALCQQFLWSRLMYNAVDPSSRSFRDRGLWQVTPKGLSVLADFCQRTKADHPMLHETGINRLCLVTLDRSDDDQLVLNRQNMAFLFRTLMNGLSMDTKEDTQQDKIKDKKNQDGTMEMGGYQSDRDASNKRNSMDSIDTCTSTDSPPGLSVSSTDASVNSSCSSSNLSDRFQLLDNRLLQSASSVCQQQQQQQQQRRRRQQQQQQQSTSSSPLPKRLHTIFSTQACCDWLVSYCTIVNRDEAEIVTTEFLRHGWINYQNESDQLNQPTIQSSRGTLVLLTTKGRHLILDTRRPTHPSSNITTTSLSSSSSSSSSPSPPSSSSSPSSHSTTTESSPSSTLLDGGSARLMVILQDAQLRSLFTDFLHANFCSENLNFWIDYNNLRRKCKLPSQNQKDLLEDAYAIWSNYLSPGAKWELNVDHDLQKEIARLVPSMMKLVPTNYAPTMINTSAQSNAQCLRTLLKRLDQVHVQVCRLMSNDSVPKFIAWIPNNQKMALGLDGLLLKI